MSRKTNKAIHQTEPPENIQTCLNCKLKRCGGEERCMKERRAEMLKTRKIYSEV